MTGAKSRERVAVAFQPGPGSDAEEKKVGIWLRVSTEDQVKGESPAHHESRARMYAEMKGWDVATVYNLEAVSGKSVLGHPEARRMLADVAAGSITVLIFSKIARLARNTRELIDIAEVFREFEADLVSLQESIDTSTPGGRNIFRIMASMAEWEREEIAERVAASVPVRAKLGKSLGGAAPFGYEWQEGRLRLHETEAPIRREIYQLFLRERRLKQVARLLNQQGFRTRSGARWSDTTVQRLLEDPIATGHRRVNTTKSTGDKKHWVRKPESEWVIQEVPALISEEVFAGCARLLSERKAKAAKRPARRTAYLMSGLVFCVCGAKMYPPSNTPKYVCQSCRNKIPIADLDLVFREELRRFCLSPDAVAAYFAGSDGELGRKRDLLQALESDAGKVQAEMDKLYRLYLSDELAPEQFGRRNRPLEARLMEIEAELPRLQGEIDFLGIQRVTSEEIVSEAEILLTRWGDLPFDEQRAIVEAMVERITVGKDEIDLSLTLLTFSSNRGKKATPPHGFIAAISAKRAGKVKRARARTTLTIPSSSGWRSASSVSRRNSGSSSKNRTPLCARLASPGRAEGPPPIMPTVEVPVCGLRNGRSSISPAGGSSAASDQILVTSIASARASRGSRPGRRRASIVLPEPGGPRSSRLWPPAAAISSALFAPDWPRTSARSAFLLAAEKKVISRGEAGVSGPLPSAWSIASMRWATPNTGTPPSAAASGPFAAGSSSSRIPRRAARSATARPPRTERTVPSRPSSPQNRRPLRLSSEIWP